VFNFLLIWLDCHPDFLVWCQLRFLIKYLLRHISFTILHCISSQSLCVITPQLFTMLSLNHIRYSIYT